MSAVRPVTGLIASIGICFAFAGLGSVLTATSVDSWYASLKKPAWIPPTWIFAPVWSALYLTMAVAAWLVWCRAGFAQARPALIIFGVQLLLNVGWSAISSAFECPEARWSRWFCSGRRLQQRRGSFESTRQRPPG